MLKIFVILLPTLGPKIWNKKLDHKFGPKSWIKTYTREILILAKIKKFIILLKINLIHFHIYWLILVVVYQLFVLKMKRNGSVLVVLQWVVVHFGDQEFGNLFIIMIYVTTCLPFKGRLLTGVSNFDELLDLAEQGSREGVDTLVKDIYGQEITFIRYITLPIT